MITRVRTTVSIDAELKAILQEHNVKISTFLNKAGWELVKNEGWSND